MTNQMHCRSKKSDGSPCKTAFGLSAQGLCLQHDPARASDLRELRAAGGRAAGAAKRAKRAAREATLPDDLPAIPRTLDDATRYFAWIVDAMGRGQLDARTGHEMSYALNGFKAAAEKRDLERRLTVALRELAEYKKQKPRRVS